jgi:hypothetical protein
MGSRSYSLSDHFRDRDLETGGTGEARRAILDHFRKLPPILERIGLEISIDNGGVVKVDERQRSLP